MTCIRPRYDILAVPPHVGPANALTTTLRHPQPPIAWCCELVTEPYTVREARIHVRHVRDLLKSVGLQDAYASIDCSSLSLLNIITSGNILGL